MSAEMPPTPRGMKMPKAGAEVTAAFRAIVPEAPGVALKPMFGNLSAFVNGNMFAGVFGDDLFVRLPEEEAAKVKAAGGRDFEPMPGRAMKGYVLVPPDWRAAPAGVTPLLERALELTGELPAKR
jgi:TfoX/Sxy family transcriptional regulator of competence genes